MNFKIPNPYIIVKGQKVALYDVLLYGKPVHKHVLGWRKALKLAEKYEANLFYGENKVEILNIFTGEIVTLREAQRRVAQRRKTAVQ